MGRSAVGILSGALAFALLGAAGPLVLTPATAVAAGDEAVAYQNNPAHSGGQAGDSLRPMLQKKWSVDPGAGTFSYPLIAGGLVYVVAQSTITDSRLFAFDQASGQTRWTAALGGSWADAAYDNGTVFTISSRGVISAFDGQTGAPSWSRSLADSNNYLFDSPPTAANGVVYTAGSGYGGTLFALRESDGRSIWSRPVQEGQESAPAVSSAGVYVSYPGEVYDFAPGNGSLLWKYSQGYGGGGTTPVLAGNSLYYRDPSTNGAGIVFDAGSGRQLGSFTSTTPPVFDGASVFLMAPGTSYGGTLEARNTTDNALRWSFAGDGGLVVPPVAVNGYVYTGSTTGRLWALDEATGRPVWSDNVGASIYGAGDSGMAIGNGLLAVPGGTGLTLYGNAGTPPPPPPSPAPPPVPAGPSDVAFQVDSLHSGSQPSETMTAPLARRWSRNLGGAASYPLVAQGMAFVASAAGTTSSGGPKLWALSLQDGSTVWGPLDLGGTGYQRAGLTYDAGSVFALNYYGLLQAFDAGTGLLRWSRKLPGQFYSSAPPTARNGVVFAAAEENGSTIYAVDERNGAILWPQPDSAGGSQSSPAVSDSGVYVSFSCQQVSDYSPADGHLIWHHDTSCHGGGGTTPALDNNRLFVRDPAGNLILDANSGSVVGAFAASAPPAFDGSRAFFLNGTTLEAHDLTSNALLWRFTGDGALISAPLSVNGTVYVGSSRGLLFAVNESTGAQTWSDQAAGSITGPNESTIAVPLTGMAAGEGSLLLPAGTTLVSYGAAAPPPPPPAPAPHATYTSVTSTQQYRLADSNGMNFTAIDAGKLAISVTPAFTGTAVLTGNADLWTATAGYNQDLAIVADWDGVSNQPLAWKESGGFGGTYSPNAAAVQATTPITIGQPMTFRLAWRTNKPETNGASIFAGAGPINGAFSPTRLSLRLIPNNSQFPVTTRTAAKQYSLSSSDGAHWTPIDTALATSVSPASNSTVRLTANADLWTATIGVNQDLAIMVSVDGAAPQAIAWKESGGRSGTFSPNAAFVQAVYQAPGGHNTQFSLAWKTNRPFAGPGAIYAGAGGFVNGAYSETSLYAEVVPPPPTAWAANQYSLTGSNGIAWTAVDSSSLKVTVAAGSAVATAVLGANADLFTDTAGINQDLAIFVSVDGGPDQLVAWKESGGFNGTYSPNAAFVEADYQLQAGLSYVFTLKWKSNRAMTAVAGIHAGAGPLGSSFSPTSLVLEVVSPG